MADETAVPNSVERATVLRQLQNELDLLHAEISKTGEAVSAGRVMEACQFLRNQEVKKITVAAVGEYCEKQGGPKTQSILNKPATLRRLVQLHSDIYNLESSRVVKKVASPHNGLKIDDPGVAAYVRSLESQVRELERANERLTQGFRKLAPLQIGAPSETSASDTGAPTIGASSFISEVEKDAIAKFLSQTHLDKFGLTLDERQRLVDGRSVLMESPIVRLLARMSKTA